MLKKVTYSCILKRIVQQANKVILLVNGKAFPEIFFDAGSSNAKMSRKFSGKLHCDVVTSVLEVEENQSVDMELQFLCFHGHFQWIFGR